MTHRKEVFQSKVLQKLYPAAPKLEEKDSSSCKLTDTFVNKKHVKRKPTHQDIPHTLPPKNKRMYTVLPPPEDYVAQSMKNVTPPQLESINSSEGSSEDDIQQCSEEIDQERKRRRKRRKRKLGLQGEKDEKAKTTESSIVQNEMRTDEVHITRNKKRKLKKKRHKEKMVSLGLVPRASALEFTYRKENNEEEEEEDGTRAAQVAEFLRTTMEVYKSDCLLHKEKLPELCGLLENLVSSISSGKRPSSLLKHLQILQLCIQDKDIDGLEEALQELESNNLMAADSGLPQCLRGAPTREDHARDRDAFRRRGDRDVRVQLQATGAVPPALQPRAAEGRLVHRRQRGRLQGPLPGCHPQGWSLPGDPGTLLCGPEVCLKKKKKRWAGRLTLSAVHCGVSKIVAMLAHWSDEAHVLSEDMLVEVSDRFNLARHDVTLVLWSPVVR